MDRKLNILIISFYYPPGIAAGGFRMSCLATHLSKKIDITVITAENQKEEQSINNVEIIRAAMCPKWPLKQTNRVIKGLVRFWRKNSVPDPFVGWVIFAVLAALKVNRRKTIDIIVATGPPFSVMIIPYVINKLVRIPYILDYRDPWTMYKWSIPIDRARFRKIEERIIKNAKLVVNVTKRMNEEYVRESGYKQAKIITNGYENRHVENEETNASIIRIVYAGNYYGGRSLIPLVIPIRQMMEERCLKIEVTSYGKITQTDTEYIHKMGMCKSFIEREQVPREEILERIKEYDIMYIHAGKGYEYAIPYKMYDYMAVQKPILAIANKKTEIYEVINEYALGICSDDDTYSVKQALGKIVLSEYKPKKTDRYYWTEIAKEYFLTISECIIATKTKIKERNSNHIKIKHIE